MSDKEEEKSEWEDVLVPLDGLELDGGKKEDDNYDNGDLVPLDGWDDPKIDPEEYRKLKEERDRLLREKEKLETKTKAIQDQNARLVAAKAAGEERRRQLEEAENRRQYEEWKKQREKEKSSSKSGEVSKPKAEHEPSTGGLGKSLIIALLLAFGIVSYKMYDKIQKLEERSSVATATTVRTDNNDRPSNPNVKINENVNIQETVNKTQSEQTDEQTKITKPKKQPKIPSVRQQQTQSQQIAAARQPAARQYKVGDIITFGSYPFYADGREKAIDWKILDIDADNNALVISDYALDNVSYNKEWVDITWEDSSIRKWLNNDFLNKAFSPEQRRKIISSRITNKDNADYNTRGGNATNDKLFLLSIEEADKYFNSDESRIAYPTPYAKSKKSVNGNLLVSSSYVSTDRGGSCWWWLRSPGLYQNHAAGVYDRGFVGAHGNRVGSECGGVRAALKINLNNL